MVAHQQLVDEGYIEGEVRGIDLIARLTLEAHTDGTGNPCCGLCGARMTGSAAATVGFLAGKVSTEANKINDLRVIESAAAAMPPAKKCIDVDALKEITPPARFCFADVVYTATLSTVTNKVFTEWKNEANVGTAVIEAGAKTYYSDDETRTDHLISVSGFELTRYLDNVTQGANGVWTPTKPTLLISTTKSVEDSPETKDRSAAFASPSSRPWTHLRRP